MLTGEELGCGEEEEALARGGLEASSPDPVYPQEARRSICILAVISNRIVNFSGLWYVPMAVVTGQALLLTSASFAGP